MNINTHKTTLNNKNMKYTIVTRIRYLPNDKSNRPIV